MERRGQEAQQVVVQELQVAVSLRVVALAHAWVGTLQAASEVGHQPQALAENTATRASRAVGLGGVQTALQALLVVHDAAAGDMTAA